MAKEVLIPLDLNQLEIQNFALQNLASDPGSPVAGQIWFDSGNSYPKVYNGAADIELKGSGHSLDEFAAAAGAIDMGSHLINNVTDPSSAQDAATKNYVDNAETVDTNLSKEETQDYAWDVLTGTQTLIDVIYDDTEDNVDFIVQESSIDHNNLINSDDSDAHHLRYTDSEASSAVSASDVGLGNVENIALSTAVWSDMGIDPTDVTKADVGLDSVPNTDIAYASAIPADVFTSTEVSNLQSEQLSDGSTPWTSSIDFTGGDGISAIGPVSLGGSATIAIAFGGVAENELDLGISPTWTGAHTFNGGLDAGGNRITSVADPTNGTDAVNKSYADSIQQGLELKDSVEVATEGTSIDLTSTSDPGSIDGVTLVDGDRLLLKDQATGSENGIYVASTATDPSTWSRASDADEDSEVTDGMYTWVEQGTVNADTGFVLTTNDPVLGTDALSFSVFTSAGEYLAGDGLTRDNKTFAVGAGYGITANTDTIDADVAKYTQTIGDGAATSITLSHNLGTQDIEVAVRETDSPYAFVSCQIEADDGNNASLTFADAPAADAYQAVVIG